MRATAFIGSSAAWARYGNSNVASSTFAAPAIAVPASPSSSAVSTDAPAARERYSAMISALPRVSAALSSHWTVTASRAFSAAHMCSATTATPRGVCTTSTTPGIAFAAAASNDAAFAPNRGGWIITAVSMPGSLTSIVNGWLPSVFEGPSKRRTVSSPITVHCSAAFGAASSGTGIAAARSACSPKLALPAVGCVSRPRSTTMSSPGTPQCSAAAATSIARAAAPACR
jgi:hypothetical protein